LINKYFNKTVKNLLKSDRSLLRLLEIPLIRYSALGKNNLRNLEEYIEGMSFTNIDVPLSRLKNNYDEYYSILAELRVGKILKDEGKQDIKFLSQTSSNPDLEFIENNELKYVEVKDFMNLNPEFSILHDKLETKSLFDVNFQRDFIIQCDYEMWSFNNIHELHKSLKKAVDQLIIKIESMLKKGDLNNIFVDVDKFRFKVKTKLGKVGFLFMFSGSVIAYSSPKDCLFDLIPVYLRFITQFKEGYIQLLRKQNNNTELVKKDYLYFFLNIDKYSRVIGNEVKNIFIKLSETLGMSELTNIKFQL
ncbi:MAG: hypothetical protein AABW92_03855, partial [Nanoarchaeota archaeon]